VTSVGANASDVQRSAKARAVDLVGKVTLHTLSRVPDRLRRLLARSPITIDGNTLDPTLQLMLAGSRLSGSEGLILSEDVAKARRELNAVAKQFPRETVDVTLTEVLIPGPADDIPAIHIRPRVDDGAPLLVYYHGGGFVVGGWETHGNLCEIISDGAGAHVLFVDYRLAPEHKAPAAVDDAYAAYRWAIGQAAELGADASRVAVGGDSAGGNLAALVALRARDEGAPAPVLQLLLYPMTNFASQTRSIGLFADGFFLRRWDMEFCNDKYIGGSGIEPTDPRVSPLLADDLTGLPPALLITAGFDPLRDEGHQYAEALRTAGNTVDAREFGSLVHSFPNFFALGGSGAAATYEIISALHAHLARG
jgi:acetyl esterase